MPVVRISEHGQVTIPKPFREVLGLEKGDLAEASLEGERIVITPKKFVKDKAYQELMKLLDRVHERNKGFSEEEVIADVIQAVAELREEEYAKQKKTESRL